MDLTRCTRWQIANIDLSSPVEASRFRCGFDALNAAFYGGTPRSRVSALRAKARVSHKGSIPLQLIKSWCLKRPGEQFAVSVAILLHLDIIKG